MKKRKALKLAFICLLVGVGLGFWWSRGARKPAALDEADARYADESADFDDTSAVPGTSYQYAVRATDTSGNVSNLSTPASATTPTAGAPLWADGFETGDLTGWTTSSG